MEKAQKQLVQNVRRAISDLDVERVDQGWRPKFYLYCTEVKCPITGWMVPLLARKVVSKDWKVVLDLIPDAINKRYNLEVKYLTSDTIPDKYENGTYKDGVITHSTDGIHRHIFNVSTVRGDYKKNGETKNNLRLWEKTDFMPRSDDIFQERLYCILWIKGQPDGRPQSKFRSVTDMDIEYENKVNEYVKKHLSEWQESGYVPDMVIERGYTTDQPIRARGWTHWHHLFNPRQLLTAALVNKYANVYCKNSFTSVLNWNSKLSGWNRNQIGGGGNVKDTFYNQVLNTLFDYGCRSSEFALAFCDMKYSSFPLLYSANICSHPVNALSVKNDIYITDPPYGDAVKYEEITEFFIAWLRKNPPKEFADWTWDSRRALAIKGEGESFRQGMIAAYSAMREHMPDNGIQILMFTHQSGAIWADMANIIWASGLKVTAAWCVATEIDSALRQGAYVKSTVLLILRKRMGEASTYRDDLAEELAEAVEAQVEALTGLDQQVREKRSEGLYADADLQMAGYAAALKVLTSYSVIDGKDMVAEAKAPKRVDGKGLVDELIDFAEQTAVQYLTPAGIEKEDWKKLQPVERFYCKMAEMEASGEKSLDNYQRFAKAFKVKNFSQVMADSTQANAARLKLGMEFKGSLMSGDAEIAGTPLRALLYAAYELGKDSDEDVNDIVAHIMENCPDFHANRHLLIKLAEYLARNRGHLKRLKSISESEAGVLRVLAEALHNQKV